jgi:glycosyltransferase involved in cell wall biosynthesis
MNLTIIVPVHNEDKSNYAPMVKFLRKYFKVLVVDDGSESPVSIASFRREKAKGYGNTLKWGMRKAKTEYVGIIDADGQYDPNDLIMLWGQLKDEDMLIGRRITHQGGVIRFLGRLGLKLTASTLACHYIPDLNSGVRVFKRSLALKYASLLCDTFSFTTSLTLCFILDGLKVKWYPANFSARKGQKSTLNALHHGLITLYQIIWITVGLRTRVLRKCLRG